jgi:hypothetical protein
MSDKMEIKRGTKIEADEAKELDRSKMAIMLASPPQTDDVQGQAYYSNYTQCPWCGHIGWTHGLDTDYYVVVYCGWCGQPFRA